MKQFYIITNQLKDPENKITERIKAYLEQEGTIVYQGDMPPKETECILVLGGDGTLLKAARDHVDQRIPLIGVNLGTLGYLTEVDANNFRPSLDALIKDEFQIEERMMLTAEITSKGQKLLEEEAFSLNDVVISRGRSFRIISYDVYVNGQFLNHYQADGIIISTPTGSTGYNLSAGGPIVDPTAMLMLVTPICPHTINTRSIILSPEDQVEIRIPTGKDGLDQEVEVYFDSSMSILLHTGDKIKITKFNKITKIIKIRKVSFLEALHKKMSS